MRMDLTDTELQLVSSLLFITVGFFYCFLTYPRQSSRAPNQSVRDNLRMITNFIGVSAVVNASALGLVGVYGRNWLPIVFGVAGVVLNLVGLRAFMRSGATRQWRGSTSALVSSVGEGESPTGEHMSLRRWVLWSLLVGVLLGTVFATVTAVAADRNLSSSDFFRESIAGAILFPLIAVPLGLMIRYADRKQKSYPKEWDPKGMTAGKAAFKSGAFWFAIGFGLALFNKANLPGALLVGVVVGGSFAAIAHYSFVRGSRIERDKP